MFLGTIFSFCSTEAVAAVAAGGGGSSQLFLIVFAEPTSASETFEIPATMLAIFFLPVESAAATIGESFTPPDNLLIGESEVLRALGEACFRPVGDGCRYLDGTIIDGSLEVFRFSSRAAIKLGTTHFDGTGDADLFPLPAGDGSLSTGATTAIFFFPADIDLLGAAGDENL